MSPPRWTPRVPTRYTEPMARRYLVTGANKGIGLAVVRAILEEVSEAEVLLGSRDAERGAAAVDALREENAAWAERVEVLPLDVADPASVQAAASTVSGRGQGLAGLVNNAGIGLGTADAEAVLAVNTWGPKRVCDAFVPLLDPAAPGRPRVVNVSSASGPMYVARCAPDMQRRLTRPEVTWREVEGLLTAYLAKSGSRNHYGFSKACLNAYTIHLARERPDLVVNACTPGYIETDLTRPSAEARGADPADLGMEPPSTATRVVLHLLVGDPGGTGWYFGSDALRSPLDRYRGPGDPPYEG